MKCPHCGHKIPWSDWVSREYDGFTLGAAAVPAGAEYERKRPARDANIETDVITPAIQSLITGVVTGACAAAAASLLNWDQPAVTGVTTGTGVLSAVWVILLREQRSLLWEIERITGADIDGDGRVGPPEPAGREREPVRVEVSERSGRYQRIRYIDLPATVSDDDISSVARAVLVSRRNFSRRDLDISPETYRDLSERMLDGGLLRYRGNGPRSGLELTGVGRSFLRQYITHPPQR
jgi:hypothetical protein